MKELKFTIETFEDCEKVTIFENGIKCHIAQYHKGTSESVMMLQTVAEWYDNDNEVQEWKQDTATPCEYGECPYDAEYSDACRYYCGLGVDENEIDE